MALTKTEFENISKKIESKISGLLTHYPNNYGELAQRHYNAIMAYLFFVLMLSSVLISKTEDDYVIYFMTGFFGLLISFAMGSKRKYVMTPVEIDNSMILNDLQELETSAEGYEDVARYCADNRQLVKTVTEQKVAMDHRFRIWKRVVYFVTCIILLPLDYIFYDLGEPTNYYYKQIESDTVPTFSLPVVDSDDTVDLQMICYQQYNRRKCAFIKSINVPGARKTDVYEVSIVDTLGLAVPFFNRFVLNSEREKEVSDSGITYKNLELSHIVDVVDGCGNISIHFTRGIKALRERRLRLKVEKLE